MRPFALCLTDSRLPKESFRDFSFEVFRGREAANKGLNVLLSKEIIVNFLKGL